MNLRNTLVGYALLGVAFGSSALSLGRTRGGVVLGQPIDLAVDVKVDAAEDAIPQCFAADVFHADSAVDPNRVRIVVQALSTTPQDVVVRIRSSAAVDEPVVSVVLRYVCGQRGSRRYDFLTDFPTDAAVAAAPPPTIAEVPAAAAANSAPQSASGAVTGVPATGAVQAPMPVPPRAVPAGAATAKPRPAPSARATPRPVARPAPAPKPAAAPTAKAALPRTEAPVAGKPRLRLEAPSDQLGALRGTAQMSSVPTENLPQRAEAAAAWRALNVQPEDVLRDGQRLQALEEQDKGGREARAKAEAELKARLERAERRLDEAENNRLDATIFYALIALLLLAIAAAVLFWNRARKSASEAMSWARSPDAEAARNSQLGPVSRPAAKASLTEELRDEGVNESLFESLKKAPTSGSVPLRVVTPVAVAAPVAAAAVVAERSSGAAQLRAVSPEEFFDIQQHADFFVSLGQYDQAIEVLKKHIEENAEMSPLAFLELFKLYHTLSRQTDYNALRDEFQRVFNARIPNFAAFADEGLGLEDYPAALLSIETAWGDPRVLDTIEANLFRKPGDTGKPFDLAAFRDLLLLYAVARTLLRKDGAEGAPAERGGRMAARGGNDDHAFAPQRLTRPDFSASLTQTYPAHQATAPVRPTAELDPDTTPVVARSVPSYDQGLVLDLDLSNSEMQALEAQSSRRAAEPAPAPIHASAPVAEVDIDLPLLEMEEPEIEAPSVLQRASQEGVGNKPQMDSGLIDFDLFDPNTEARIAPKSTR